MIGRLTGLVIDHDVDGACVLDVQGVGYEVFVPLRIVPRMPLSEPLTLHVHTHVREDALVLYGFLSPEDRSAFRVLLGVSGVGPKLAMTVLSELSAQELSRVLARGERARLEAISGVGKKTAARLLLELRDKLSFAFDPVQNEGTPEAPPPGPGDTASLLCAALTRMGFTRGQAEAAVARIDKADHALPMEQLLRKALAALG